MSKTSQEEAERRVKERCEERNFELVEPFVYKNSCTKIHLSCNKDEYHWYMTYNHFMRGVDCPKCLEY